MGRLKEGEDYYTENGKMILTHEFLLKRGKCCNNTCKNCPYSIKLEENEK